MLPYVISGKTDIKFLLGNAANNEVNTYIIIANMISDYNDSELLYHCLVKKQIVKIFFNI
jgi:hypothetical protein